jgi:membrane-associated phospholipid phosphatase
MAKAPVRRDRTKTSSNQPTWTALELALGVVLLAVAAGAGLLLAHRPGENRLDTTGFFFLPWDPSSPLAKQLVKLGSAPVLVIGVAAIFMAEVYRDRIRAFACAVAPIAAVVVVEHVAKPMVGRELSGFYTYPSGTVTVTAAIATSAYLVCPKLLRPLAAALGALAVVGVSAGVLVLRWHFPTDVVGGICVGAGSVLFLDAAAHLPGLLRRHRQPPAAPPPPERRDTLVSA